MGVGVEDVEVQAVSSSQVLLYSWRRRVVRLGVICRKVHGW